MKIRYTVFLSLFLTLQFAVNAQQSYMIDQIVGIVGTKPIKLSEVESEYYQQKAQGNTGISDLKCEVFESLLGQKLLVNQAMLDSVKVSESQVDAELTRTLNGAVAQLGSTEKVEKQYNKTISEIKEDLRDSYRDMQMARSLQSTIIEDVKITPTEVAEFYNNIPPDSIPTISTQVEVAQLGIYPAYSEQAILLAKEKLLELRKRILAGDKFQSLARMYSEDEGTAVRNGETGFISFNEVDPEYARAAFALKKAGDVSRIVESKAGYHLIQLVEKRADRINTRHILVKPKADPNAIIRAMQTLDSIALFIRRDSMKFEKAVMFYSQDLDTRFNMGLVSNPAYGGAKLDLENHLAPVDYNTVKKLKVGEISSAYEARDRMGKIIFKIITLKSITPTHKANLHDDYNMIQEYAKNQKKTKIMETWFVDKQRSSYIHVDESFKKCEFRTKGWIKE